MISIILAVILGIVFASVATQNPMVVPVSMFGSIFNLPLYLVSALSFLVGVAIALFFHLFDLGSASKDMKQHEDRLKELTRGSQNLQAQVNKLTSDNMGLRRALEEARVRIHNEHVEGRRDSIKNFFGRIRQNLSL